MDRMMRDMGISILGMAMMPGGMTTIIDTKDSTFLMMMEMGGKKKGMCMDMNSKEFQRQMEKQKQDNPDYSKFTKTTDTKVILGHTCTEYTYKDEETEMHMWITDEVENIFKNYTGSFGNAGGFSMPSGMDGMFLGMTMKTKKQGNIEVVSEVTELNTKTATEISTAGYTFETR